MKQFEPDLSTVKQVFDVLELEQNEINKKLDEFKHELSKRMVEAVMKKLPEQKREQISNLANSKNEVGLAKKLEYWLNEKEVNSLYAKIADELFLEMLRGGYKEADETQKGKLEEMFEKKVLLG